MRDDGGGVGDAGVMRVCNVGEPCMQRDMDGRERERAIWLMSATSDVGKRWEINDRQRCEW